MFDLAGKTAVVTGGTGVLGAAICRGLVQAGAAVAVLARTEARVLALAESLQAAGGQALGVPADTLDRAGLEQAARRVYDQFGRVDILVNAAGGNRPASTVGAGQSFFDLPPEALQAMFNLNCLGAMLAAQVFGRGMAEQGAGVIVNLSSMAASRPLTRVVAYSAAKAALENFTRWLAVHLAQSYSPRIRVNAVAPGFFLGEQNRDLLIERETGALTPRGQQIIAHTPLGRFGEPDDLVGALVWLASDAARFVTGIVVPVDGGFSAFSGV